MTEGLKTCATLFSGGGGFEVGARAAGLSPIWGVEIDEEIAGVYRRNVGADVIVSPAEAVDYSKQPRPYWLHMSPVCKNASVAKTDGEEAAEDIAMAEACARAIRQCDAPRVSLENVWGYRNFESFRIILRALDESGYAFNYWHLNCADYGVPQTRKRLILLASKSCRPRMPKPTHTRTPQAAGLFGEMSLPKWVGWYAAIEDLIPTLPESKFADWQLKRLPTAFTESVLINNHFGDADGSVVNSRATSEPAHSITALNPVRAFLLDGKNSGSEWGDGRRGTDEPAMTVVADDRPSHRPRAFIVDGKPSDYEGGELAIFDGDDPVNTLTATQTKHPLRAFIAHPTADCERFLTREAGEPVFTILSNGNGLPRAFLCQGTSTLDVRGESEPSACVVATVHSKAAKPRAWLSHGKVVSMTPRALARFQSIPDEYELPTKAGLACKVIGNMVPPLLGQRIVESEESLT